MKLIILLFLSFSVIVTADGLFERVHAADSVLITKIDVPTSAQPDSNFTVRFYVTWAVSEPGNLAVGVQEVPGGSVGRSNNVQVNSTSGSLWISVQLHAPSVEGMWALGAMVFFVPQGTLNATFSSFDLFSVQVGSATTTISITQNTSPSPSTSQISSSASPSATSTSLPGEGSNGGWYGGILLIVGIILIIWLISRRKPSKKETRKPRNKP